MHFASRENMECLTKQKRITKAGQFSKFALISYNSEKTTDKIHRPNFTRMAIQVPGSDSEQK